MAAVYGILTLVAAAPGALVLHAGRAAPADRGGQHMSTATSQRPYVLLSCSLSLDGYLDNASHRRLVLSNAADLDRVDGVRAGCDAILVGAATVRADNPRLLVRSQLAAGTAGRARTPRPVR